MYISDQPTTVSGSMHTIRQPRSNNACWWRLTNSGKVLNKDIASVSEYLKTWKLKLSTTKAVLAVFHLNNKEAKHGLKVNHNNGTLPFCSEPTYLWVVLDKALKYRRHLKSLRKKLTSRVALLRRLAGSGCWNNNGLTILDDETIDWLLNTCPEIECGQTVDWKNWLKWWWSSLCLRTVDMPICAVFFVLNKIIIKTFFHPTAFPPQYSSLKKISSLSEPRGSRLRTTALNAMRVGKWRVLCNRETRVIRFFVDQSIFDFTTSIFNHLHNKTVSAQQNTHSLQILYTVPPKNYFLRGEFLFVRRKRHARLRSILSSYQVMV